MGLIWILKNDISSKYRRPETVCIFRCHHLNKKSARCALETPMSWRGPPVWTTNSYLYEFITILRGLPSLIQTSPLLTHEYFLCHMKPGIASLFSFKMEDQECAMWLLLRFSIDVLKQREHEEIVSCILHYIWNSQYQILYLS